MEQQNLIKTNNELQVSSKLQPEEIQIVEAHNTKKLSEANDMELKRVLGVLSLMIGLQNALTEIEEIILLDALRNVYPSIGIQELQLAFIMALSDKLTLEKDAKEHFGILSFKYISGILSAYIRYAKTVINKIETAYKPPELPIPKLTDSEYIEDAYALWFGMKNKTYHFANPFVYQKLVNKGLINLNDEEKEAIKTKAIQGLQELKTSKNFKDLQTAFAYMKTDKKYNDLIQEMCKKYAVAEYFNKLFEQGKLSVL